MCLGGAEAALGNADEGLELLDRSVAESRAEGEPWQLAVALNDCALIRHFLHQPGREPREMLEESIALLRQLGDDWSLGNTLDSLAIVALDNGDTDRAWRLWVECAGIARRFDDKLIGGVAINGMGRIAIVKASYARALQLHSAAAHLLREWGKSLVPMEQAVIDGSIAEAHKRLGEVEADIAWAAGDNLTLSGALEYALAESPA
jgi:hypothetical protein